MKKKLIVISMERTAVERHVANLRTFFEDRILIEGYYYQGNHSFPKIIRGDLILLTSQELTAKVRSNINTDAQIIYIERTLMRQQVEHLMETPLPERVMLVDYSEFTATRMISLLTEFGVRNLELIPVGRETPDRIEWKDAEGGIRTAITAALPQLVPAGVETVIDLGWAPVDTKTLLEISVILDLYNEKMEIKLFHYMQELITSQKSFMFFLKSTIDSKNIYKTIMELMEDGVLITDSTGRVRSWNQELLSVLKLTSAHVRQPADLDDLLPQSMRTLMASNDTLRDTMLYFPEIKQNLFITKLPINVFESVEGFMLIVKGISGIAQRNARIRRQMQRTIYQAKYTFEDILGNSEKLRNSKETARRLAQVDATVLITGESGTGKELFAQSIHNASPRREMPFVAINCAALSSSLLDSELFGYERGAFTGARSEGHVGVFELAHRGTIFLDEVGELPLDVQAKLLRVLEEREVRRVGGETNIPVDVRVVAATNQDLQLLCQKKQFRTDLFYRLNILPLRLVPLRERREDIPLLVQRFLAELHAENKLLTPRLIQALMSYRWEGNGRELHNCVQYMTYLSDDLIDTEQLPEYIRLSLQCSAPMTAESAVPSEASQLLGLLAEEPMGRIELTGRLKALGLSFSEYRVRQLLKGLQEQGYVLSHRGRSGLELTEKGIWLLRQLD